MRSVIPPKLTRGWRQSLRTGAWYRREGSWLAVVTVTAEGYLIIVRRTARAFEDVLADANAVLQ